MSGFFSGFPLVFRRFSMVFQHLKTCRFRVLFSCLHLRRIRDGSAHNPRGRHSPNPRTQGNAQPNQRTLFRLLSRLCVMPARMHARFIGRSAQFQNLSTRNVAQIFPHVLRADPPETQSAEKRFASKERDKSACTALGGIWGRRKNAGCIVFLPNGGGATHRRTARHNGHSTSIARTACKRRQRRQDTKGKVIQAFTSASLAAVHSLSWIGGFWRELVQAQTDRQKRHAETGE